MTTDPDRYLTLAGCGTRDQRVQRSRFLGYAAPVSDATAAEEVVARLRREHHAARHVCSAWRLGEPAAVREARSDDGEPAGTAGEPILAAIRGAAVSDVVVAVVRYFGGVKLGTGGLVRAYGDAAAAALADAPRREVWLGGQWDLALSYEQQKTVRHLLAAHGGQPVAEQYGAHVQWTVWLPRRAGGPFAAAVREATAGRVTARPRPGDAEPGE